MPDINTLLDQHVTLVYESCDRIFLNGYVAKLQEPDQLRWFLCQHRGEEIPGSVSQLVDASGNSSASYGYKAYGQTDSGLTQGDPDPLNPVSSFRYSAKHLDTGSATLDMGVRRFGPDVSRFLTPDLFFGALANLALSLDPITQNRYGLAGGNPIGYREWDGHVALDAGGGGAATSPQSDQTGQTSQSTGGGGSGNDSLQAKAQSFISGLQDLGDRIDPCHDRKTGFSDPLCNPPRKSNLSSEFTLSCGLQGLIGQCHAVADMIANDPTSGMVINATGGDPEVDALAGARAARAQERQAARQDAEDKLVLYHGSPEFKGGKFDLDTARARTRAGTGEPGIYLTDSAERAITQFGREGQIVRVELSRDFALGIRQLDPSGRVEYFVNTQEQVNILNQGITSISSARDAILAWARGQF